MLGQTGLGHGSATVGFEDYCPVLETTYGETAAVATLLLPQGEAYLFPEVTLLQDISCHLATAHLALAGEPWAVISNVVLSLQTFAVYGQRFGRIEPHFKDYKSAAFELIPSHLHDAQALNCLLMLLAAATLIAIAVAVVVVGEGRLMPCVINPERRRDGAQIICSMGLFRG